MVEVSHQFLRGTSETPASDPRERLYASYVSTHTADAMAGDSDPSLIHHVLPRLPDDSAARILDVGCGAGDMVRVLRAHGFTDVHGIDYSEEQVALAAERGIAGIEHEDLHAHLGSRHQTYDVILALDVLEHFKTSEVMQVLDLVAAALRPGGVFVARTPNATSPFMGRYRYGDFTNGGSFTPGSLRQVLGAAGFRDVTCFPVEPVPHGLVSAIRFGLWRLIGGTLKLCLAVETGEVRGHIVTQNLIVRARRP